MNRVLLICITYFGESKKKKILHALPAFFAIIFCLSFLLPLSVRSAAKPAASSAITGWVTADDEWFYYDKDGKKETGWLTLDDDLYYLCPDGRMMQGWYYEDGFWYLFGTNGARKDGTFSAGNHEFTFDKDGHWLSGSKNTTETGKNE